MIPDTQTFESRDGAHIFAALKAFHQRGEVMRADQTTTMLEVGVGAVDVEAAGLASAQA